MKVNRKRDRWFVGQLAGLVVVISGLATLTLVVSGAGDWSTSGIARAATTYTYDGNDLETNASHPHFWSVGGADFVGKMYKLAPADGSYTHLWAWSGTLDKLKDDDRFVVYQQFTNDAVKGTGIIEEWEEWERSSMGGLRWGGRVAQPQKHYFYFSWMDPWVDTENISAAKTFYQDTSCTQLGSHFPGANVGSRIDVYAKGTYAGGGYPQFQLMVTDKVMKTFTVTSSLAKYSYTFDPNWLIAGKDVKVQFINDYYDSVNKQDRNLYVDRIEIDGVRYYSSDPSSPHVYSTGTWSSSNGCGPGYKNSGWLHCNGYLHFTHMNWVSLNYKEYGGSCQTGWNYSKNSGLYLATYLREYFGPANSGSRAVRCDRDIPSGTYSVANKICKTAPHVARVDQRYGGGGNSGCEAAIYAWGYPEIDTDSKNWKYWMRNGEIAWAGYAQQYTGIKSPQDNNFWLGFCDNVWFQKVPNTRKQYYTGRYRLYPYDYIDDGTTSNPTRIYTGS